MQASLLKVGETMLQVNFTVFSVFHYVKRVFSGLNLVKSPLPHLGFKNTSIKTFKEFWVCGALANCSPYSAQP